MNKTNIDRDTLEDMYCEALDEQGMIHIGTLEYYPSFVLEKVDPIAYRCGLSDYYDSISDEFYCKEME